MKTSKVIRRLAHSPIYQEALYMCVALERCNRPDLWDIPQDMILSRRQINDATTAVMDRIRPWHSLQQYLVAERGGYERNYPLDVRIAWFDEFANELEAKGL